jgi:hypothetical protein
MTTLPHSIAFVSILALALCACGRTGLAESAPDSPIGDCPITSSALAVDSATDLGAFPLPSSVRTAAGGASARIGDRMLWTLAEAELAAPADNGDLVRSAIGAWSSPDSPFDPAYALLADGSPVELIALTGDERTFNSQYAPLERLVLWPSGVVATGPASGLIFYGKYLVKPGFLQIQGISAGAALISEGDAVAVRDMTPLFNSADVGFILSPLVEGDHLYAYTCDAGDSVAPGCSVGRVPLAAATDLSQWQTYNGSAWVSDFTQRQSLFAGPPADLSVAWHSHLGRYVALYVEAFTGKVMLRSAPRPEGPFTEPVLAFHTMGDMDYAAKEHPGLSGDCGRIMKVTYYHSDPDGGGELRIVDVRLR